LKGKEKNAELIVFTEVFFCGEYLFIAALIILPLHTLFLQAQISCPYLELWP